MLNLGFHSRQREAKVNSSNFRHQDQDCSSTITADSPNDNIYVCRVRAAS